MPIVKQLTGAFETYLIPFHVRYCTKTAMRETKGEESLEANKMEKNGRSQMIRTRIRLCRKAFILLMSQTRLAVTTEKSGLVGIEPRIDPHTMFRAASGVTEVKFNQSLWLFVCNFGRVERRLQKNMVILTATKGPSLITKVSGSLGLKNAGPKYRL